MSGGAGKRFLGEEPWPLAGPAITVEEFLPATALWWQGQRVGTGLKNGACGKGQMWLDRGCGSADWDCYVAIGKCLALTCSFLCRRRSTKKKWITKCLRYILRMLNLTSSRPQAKSLALHCIWIAQTSTMKSRSFILSQLPIESSFGWSWVGSLNKIKSF